MTVVDELEPEAQEIGSINTIIVRKDFAGKPYLVGQNFDWEGVRQSVLASLAPAQQKLEAPFGKGKSGFSESSSLVLASRSYLTEWATTVIGGGGTTRAAVYALSRMGLSPIFLVNRDPSETQEIIKHFPQYDLRALESVDEWTQAEEDSVVCGVGAIPSFEPVTPGEKNVYALATRIFGGFVRDGRTRTFLEMCYKVSPRVRRRKCDGVLTLDSFIHSLE